MTDTKQFMAWATGKGSRTVIKHAISMALFPTLGILFLKSQENRQGVELFRVLLSSPLFFGVLACLFLNNLAIAFVRQVQGEKQRIIAEPMRDSRLFEQYRAQHPNALAVYMYSSKFLGPLLLLVLGLKLFFGSRL